MTRKAIYAGTFDPITFGHVDILARAAKLFDVVIILVSQNTTKQTMFTVEERVQFIKAATSHLENIEIYQHQGGLTVEVAQKLAAQALIRGVRNLVDFEYEQNIATLNSTQQPEIETVMLFSNPQFRSISSSFIKEIARYGGKIEAFVPELVARAIYERYRLDECRQFKIEVQ